MGETAITPQMTCGPTCGCGGLTPFDRVRGLDAQGATCFAWQMPKDCAHCGKAFGAPCVIADDRASRSQAGAGAGLSGEDAKFVAGVRAGIDAGAYTARGVIIGLLAIIDRLTASSPSETGRVGEYEDDAERIRTLNRFVSSARRAFNSKNWDLLGEGIATLNAANREYAERHPFAVKLVQSSPSPASEETRDATSLAGGQLAAVANLLHLEWDRERRGFWLPAEPGPIYCVDVVEAVREFIQLASSSPPPRSSEGDGDLFSRASEERDLLRAEIIVDTLGAFIGETQSPVFSSDDVAVMRRMLQRVEHYCDDEEIAEILTRAAHVSPTAETPEPTRTPTGTEEEDNG